MDAAHVAQAQELAQSLRDEGTRIEISEPLFDSAGTQSVQYPTATCMDVLLNPQFDVVEFGDGTGSIENWSILYQKVCYSSQTYASANHSVIMSDGPCSVNPDDVNRYNTFYEQYMEYDSLAQGFWAPPNLTSIRFSYMAASADLDDGDWAGSQLWTLDSEGYLDEYLVGFYITESEGAWGSRWWEITQADHPIELSDASGKPLALVFYLWGDDLTPQEWLWLDDAQLQVCYNRGVASVYLPLAAKQYGTSSGPTCVPREPDSVGEMGKTALGATCGGSFSALDEKDYYDLNLTTAASAQEAQANIPIRLRLFNLPNGTNWDAMIYQNSTGYPLACQIGTPGDSNKDEDCTLDSNKNYFVLVSRGPETSPGGTYQMSVTRR